jgi:hypothetical protein
MNFIGSNALLTDIDGFESWGIYTNIKRLSLRNMIIKHLKNKQAKKESNFHISDRPIITENFLKQLTIRKPNEKNIMVKPYDHARDEAESCAIYSEAAFVLAFREFEHGPDFDDFKQWNKRKPTADSGNGVSIVGSIFQ